MEENKYFKPEISDIYVGYECEIKAPLYEGKKYIIDEDQVQYAAYCIKAGILFTPYITKEQIEADGWTYHPENSASLYFSKGERKLGLMQGVITNKTGSFFQSNITIISGEWRDEPFIWYCGNCKDINTLRYICKLLNIK